MLPVIWISFAICTKRLHDRNISGWWQAVPLAISILSAVTGGTLGTLIGIVSNLVSLALFVICGFLRGTPGTNKYGEPPV